MEIEVKLFAGFRTGRFKKQDMIVEPGTTPGRIALLLAIPLEEIGIVFVNGRHGDLDRPLAQGDVLSLFPVVGGG